MSDFCCEAFDIQVENGFIYRIVDDDAAFWEISATTVFEGTANLELSYCPFCGKELK